MNLRNATLSVLGACVLVTTVVFPGATQGTKPQSSDSQTLNANPKHNKSSALGGPVTPTQTDLFADKNSSVVPPITLEQPSSPFALFDLKPRRSSSNRPAAPFVDDPPRPSGVGIINVKTD